MKKSYLVSVQPGEDLAKLAEKLREAGADVQGTLGEIGVINVAAEPDAAPKLRGVPGVVAVEESGEIQLPPPDSEIQ